MYDWIDVKVACIFSSIRIEDTLRDADISVGKLVGSYGSKT